MEELLSVNGLLMEVDSICKGFGYNDHIPYLTRM